MQTGFYCIYKRRTAGQMNYNAAHEGSYQTYTKQPDCTNISESFIMHVPSFMCTATPLQSQV